MNENTCFKHKLFLLKLHSTYFEVNSHRKKNQPCQDKQIACYKEMDAQELKRHIHRFKMFLSVKGKFNTSLTGQTGRKKEKEPTRPPLSFSKYTSKPNKNIL